MLGPINVSDASPTSAASSSETGGGVYFGSMGSGRHTTGAAIPGWAWGAAAVVALLWVMRKKR